MSETIASQVGPRFTDRLAAHLADVQKSDRAHRLVRSEAEQKLEALTRVTAEAHEMTRELLGRLSSSLSERVEEGARALEAKGREAGAPTSFGAIQLLRFDVLVAILSGTFSDDEDEEGPAGPDMTPRDATGPMGAP